MFIVVKDKVYNFNIIFLLFKWKIYYVREKDIDLSVLKDKIV